MYFDEQQCRRKMGTRTFCRKSTCPPLPVPRQAASNLLNGNAGLSAEMVIRFENAFGVGPTR
jgi:plasmid maintenance system antidote protein VapI